MRRRLLCTLLGLVLVPGVVFADRVSADTGVEDVTELPFAEYADHVVDADGGRVFVTGRGEDDPLAVTDLSGDLVRVAPELAGAHEVAMSPNGSSLFVSVGETVRRLDPDTLQERERYELPWIRWFEDLAVTRGVLWVAGGYPLPELRRIDLRTGEVSTSRNLGGTFYRMSLAPLADRGVIAVLGSDHEPRVSTVSIRSGKRVATRAFPDDVGVEGLHASGSGDLRLVRLRGDDRRLLTLSSENLRTLSSIEVAAGSVAGVSAGSRRWAMGVLENDDHDFVRVASLRTGRVVNDYRLAFGNPVLDVDVVATFFTREGLVAVSQSWFGDGPVRLHHVPDTAATSSTLTLRLSEDAEVGRTTTARGRLTYRGEAMANARVVLSATNMYGTVEEPVVTTARTDSRGRYAVPYTPRYTEEQVTVEHPGSRRVPGAWLRRQHVIPTP